MLRSQNEFIIGYWRFFFLLIIYIHLGVCNKLRTNLMLSVLCVDCFCGFYKYTWFGSSSQYFCLFFDVLVWTQSVSITNKTVNFKSQSNSENLIWISNEIERWNRTNVAYNCICVIDIIAQFIFVAIASPTNIKMECEHVFKMVIILIKTDGIS